MKVLKPLSAMLAGGLLFSAQVAAGGLQGAVISNTCAGCHGTNGASLGEAPVIGGVSQMYLDQTMKNYRGGTRYSTVMMRIAKGYDDKEIAIMSSHYAKLPWVNAKVETDPAMVKKGQSLHNSKGCGGCHGPTGISPMPNAPRLAGQYPEFLKVQMQYMADPSKPIPPTALAMRAMLAGLSDDDLTALAHFYAAQTK